MHSEPTAGSRLDVHLPDGGHVTVAVEVDGDGSDDAELAVATAVVFGGDIEAEVVTAVEAVVEELGLTVASSKTTNEPDAGDRHSVGVRAAQHRETGGGYRLAIRRTRERIRWNPVGLGCWQPSSCSAWSRPAPPILRSPWARFRPRSPSSPARGGRCR